MYVADPSAGAFSVAGTREEQVFQSMEDMTDVARTSVPTGRQSGSDW